MSGRSTQILNRFPSHLEAGRPGKQLFTLVDALAADFDLLSERLAAIRRAHRVGDADELRDLMLLAGLHGITSDDLRVVSARADVLQSMAANLEKVANGPDADRTAAAAAISTLFGLPADTALLTLFAPAIQPPASPDLNAAALALARAIRGLIAYKATVELTRARIVRICAQHSQGNGTIVAILQAAANALDFDLDATRNASALAALISRGETSDLSLAITDGLFHSADLFWHSSFVRDRTPLTRAVPSLVPDKLVRMNDQIAVSELADQMLLRPDEVTTKMAAAGITPARPDAYLDLPGAERVAALFGFEVERYVRGAAAMDDAIALSDLSRQISAPTGDLIARLATLGLPGARRDTLLQAGTAVLLARKYGFRLYQRLGPESEIIGIEENPQRRESYPPPPAPEHCHHGSLFEVVRRGFGRDLLRLQVTGIGQSTWGPMLVNRDEGRGIGFFGNVPGQKQLIFSEDGRVRLDGLDVTTQAFSWHGACFADADKPNPNDFMFDSPRTIFVQANPAAALDRDFTFPHAGNPIDMPGIGVGVTRMAFFLQEARLSSRDGSPDTPVIRRVTPHYAIGFADQSLFAPDDPGAYPVEADVVISWLEHEAYVLRVIIPPRFKALDSDTARTPDLVAAALERFRPCGVTIRVEYREDDWILGQGVVVDQAAEDPILMLQGGTVLASNH